MEDPFERSRATMHVCLPEFHLLPLDVLWRLIVVPMRSTAELDQAFRSGSPVAARPNVAVLAGDLIAMAEFGH